MMTTNVDDKASGASARHFHIASRVAQRPRQQLRQ
jgi:hypothetical protein